MRVGFHSVLAFFVNDTGRAEGQACHIEEEGVLLINDESSGSYFSISGKSGPM